MKVLIHGINFAPELTGVGKYTGDMAAWLAAAGHEVRVVTAPPYYPAWEVSVGHHPRHFRRGHWWGAKVWRCPLWVPKTKLNGTRRMLHLLSFALSSTPMMLRHVFWRPDVVWVVEPALFCAPAAWVTARLCGAKAWLHIQDFEVDAAFELGMVRAPRWRRAIEWTERFLMRRFDVVSTISEPMLKRVVQKGVPAERAVLFPNWVDISSITPEAGDNFFRQSLAIPKHAVVALYSGNMGGKQGLEVLAEAAEILRNHPTLIFVFCGDGAGRIELMKRCAGLPDVQFLELQPVEHLSALLSMADIHLLPQRAEAADLVMPSKLTGMLSSGRPVVAMAKPGSAIDKVVRHCGLVVPPGDAGAMARALASLAELPERRSTLGAAGREYARTHLDRQGVLRRFESQLKSMVSGLSTGAGAGLGAGLGAGTGAGFGASAPERQDGA